MPSVQDTERECAAMREAAIKDADKIRAQANAEAEKTRAAADKDAQITRSGAADERIKQLMAISPRRVELLQDIKALEKQKGKLKGEIEAHERACAAERASIAKERDQAKAAAGAEGERIVVSAKNQAARLVEEAKAQIIALTGRKAIAEAATKDAEEKQFEADKRLLATNDAIREGEAELKRLADKRVTMAHEEANQISNLRRVLRLWEGEDA